MDRLVCEFLQLQQFNHFTAAPADLPFIHPGTPQPERNIILRGTQDQLLLGVLEHQTRSAPQPPQLLARIDERSARYCDAALLRAQHADGMQEQCRFA
ncbi:hypothetical protein D3C80_1775990 [compost metagenome]